MTSPLFVFWAPSSDKAKLHTLAVHEQLRSQHGDELARSHREGDGCSEEQLVGHGWWKSGRMMA